MAESEDQQAIRSIRFGIVPTPCRSCGGRAVRDVDGLTNGIPSLNQVFLDGHCTAAATPHTEAQETAQIVLQKLVTCCSAVFNILC